MSWEVQLKSFKLVELEVRIGGGLQTDPGFWLEHWVPFPEMGMTGQKRESRLPFESHQSVSRKGSFSVLLFI